jgi:hypothetical protein
MEDADFLKRLRRLIGRECGHFGRRCRLIEVLADEGTLVLEVREGLPPIHADQYGQATYRTSELVEIPIYGADRDTLSDDLLEILACLAKCADEQSG